LSNVLAHLEALNVGVEAGLPGPPVTSSWTILVGSIRFRHPSTSISVTQFFSLCANSIEEDERHGVYQVRNGGSVRHKYTIKNKSLCHWKGTGAPSVDMNTDRGLGSQQFKIGILVGRRD
jgi:hypothetical protein